jgi:hypothetical protein
MKKSIMLFSVLASLSLPAAVAVKAETGAAWPRYPYAYDGGFPAERGTIYKAPAATFDPWKDEFIPYGGSAAATGSDKGGQHALTAAELSAQLAINRGYQHETRQAIIAAGGCKSDSLPVWVHQACHYNPFGKATEGGGDGGSGGGNSGSGAK